VRFIHRSTTYASFYALLMNTLKMAMGQEEVMFSARTSCVGLIYTCLSQILSYASGLEVATVFGLLLNSP